MSNRIIMTILQHVKWRSRFDSRFDWTRFDSRFHSIPTATLNNWLKRQTLLMNLVY